MENYEKLKSVIQQANPEIMELKFGCEVQQVDKFVIVGGEKHSLIVKNLETTEVNDSLLIGPNWKILGRPIRLADCLFAITRNRWSETKEQAIRLLKLWYFLDDNLDNQSDETKQFLIDLLVK